MTPALARVDAIVADPVLAPVGDEAGMDPAVRVRVLLDGPGDPRLVRSALDALSDQALMSFGLKAYRINLLSLFGDAWSPSRVAAAARGAALSKLWGGWCYHHDYLPSLGDEPAPAELQGCPFDDIRALLAEGRGLLVATFHLGHMRFLASDIAHAGIPLCMPLAGDAYRDYACAEASNPRAAVWSCMRYVNVEEKGGALAIARVLARGGMVFSTIDGNTGMDGPRGDDRRAIVRIEGRHAKVKDGLFRMAARFGAPILPMIAVTVDGRKRCFAASPIDPGAPLSGDAADVFVERGLQAAYDVLADALRAHPEDWCGGDLFHQWRVAETLQPRESAAAAETLVRAIEGGDTLVVDDARIVPLPEADAMVWTDALTMRCYRFPEDLRGLAERLSASGVDGEWLRALDDGARARANAMLRQLYERLAIRVVGAEA